MIITALTPTTGRMYCEYHLTSSHILCQMEMGATDTCRLPLSLLILFPSSTLERSESLCSGVGLSISKVVFDIVVFETTTIT